MRISDWSSDVCSSDLMAREQFEEPVLPWHEPLEQSDRPELPGYRRRRGNRGDRQTGGRLGRRNEASDQILEAVFIDGLDGFLAREPACLAFVPLRPLSALDGRAERKDMDIGLFYRSVLAALVEPIGADLLGDRKSTRLNSSH